MSLSDISQIAVIVGVVGGVALAVDSWVHRQSVAGSDNADDIRQLKEEWRRFKTKQSEVADDWQKRCGAIEIHLAKIEEHLRYTDQRLDNTPWPKNR